jgi:UDP-N-acetylmuramoyl-tripeptide--D-alanyl-D-alanine ligase
MKLKLGQIADWIHAEGDFDSAKEALGYSIDTRTIGAGDLYFAVKGEHLDGHDFVEAAVANGVVAAVVSMRWLAPAGFDECLLLRVPDDCDDCVLRAMQTLAHAVRRSWGKRVIGVTGSAGKTTTKECVAEVLAAKFRVLKTEGNFNNHFGLPLTLLRLEEEHDVAVLEMGMNHAGEIAALCAIAQPDWGVVSNVAAVHIEFFPDGIDGVARAKKELIDALPADGVAFLNGDDERVVRFGEGRDVRVITYGTRDGVDMQAREVAEGGLSGSAFSVLFEKLPKPIAMVLRLPGRHNVLNACAALAVGQAAGVPALQAVAVLEQMRPTEKRGNQLTWNGATIINDTYNSNPSALQAMITALMKTEAERRIVVAGEMLELGPEGERLHAQCGEAAAAAGVDIVVGVRGQAQAMVDTALAASTEAVFVQTPEEAGAWMRDNVRPGDVVLLKASRGVRLERALDALGGTSAAH